MSHATLNATTTRGRALATPVACAWLARIPAVVYGERGAAAIAVEAKSFRTAVSGSRASTH